MNVPFLLWKEIFYLFIINFFISCQNMRKINAKGTSCLFCQARYFFHTSKDVNFTHCFSSYLLYYQCNIQDEKQQPLLPKALQSHSIAGFFFLWLLFFLLL